MEQQIAKTTRIDGRNLTVFVGVSFQSLSTNDQMAVERLQRSHKLWVDASGVIQKERRSYVPVQPLTS